MSSNIIEFRVPESAPPIVPASKASSFARQFVFTDKRLAELPVPARGDAIHYDKGTPLAVRITHTGKRTWLVYRRVNGRPVKLALGRVGEVLLADARREAQRVVASIAGGRDPVAERKAARAQGLTLAELWELWRKRKWSSLRPKTQQSFASNWANHIEAALGKRSVSGLGRADIQQLVDKIASKGLCATARKVRAILHVLLAEGVRLDVVPTNAATGIEAPGYLPRDRIVLGDERQRLLKAIDQAGEPWSDYFRLLMLTGVRVSALCSMAWADLDLEGAVWRVPAARSKNRQTTALPLSPDVVEILRKRLAERAGELWVFPGRSRAGHVAVPKDAWTAVLKRAGIDGLTRHDIRRSFATQMAALGASTHVIAAALGHKSTSAVRIYVHLAGEVARNAVEGAAAALTARNPAPGQ
jgi:integrase